MPCKLGRVWICIKVNIYMCTSSHVKDWRSQQRDTGMRKTSPFGSLVKETRFIVLFATLVFIYLAPMYISSPDGFLEPVKSAQKYTLAAFSREVL